MSEKRIYQHLVENCEGVIYIEGDKVMCTNCPLCVKAKRETDNHLLTFNELKREFNEGR